MTDTIIYISFMNFCPQTDPVSNLTSNEIFIQVKLKSPITYYNDKLSKDTHTCTHTYTHTHTHACMHTHYTHTHMYTQWGLTCHCSCVDNILSRRVNGNYMHHRKVKVQFNLKALTILRWS